MAGYFYDWTGQDIYTDNPEHAGRLVYGGHNRVFVDGKELDALVRKFRTGPGGWVEVKVADDNSRGEVAVEVIYGYVEFRAGKCLKSKSPIRPV